MKTRQIYALLAGAAIFAVAIEVVRGSGGEWGAALHVLLALANCCACAAMGWTLSGLRSLHPERRVTIAGVSVGAGLLLGAGMAGYWVIFPPQMKGGLPGGMAVAIAANALGLVGLFFLLGDLLARLTRDARRVRTRIILFGLVCGGLTLALERTAYLGAGSSGPLQLVKLATIGIIVWALADIVSARLTERLEQVVQALRAVTAGRLDVRLEERGRDELSELARSFNGMTGGLRERALLERAFGQYVAPSVLEAIRQRGSPRLEAHRREVSVLFADIRGFTAMSEARPPEAVVRLLDVYLERVIQVVARQEGFLNKFIGDAVMVVFNAPLDQPDHARRALACATDLQAEVARLNREGELGPGTILEVGVGVCSGPAVAGTLGSDERAEFTVIGDTVNTASRLTSAAGPGEVLLGAATARLSGMEGLEQLAR